MLYFSIFFSFRVAYYMTIDTQQKQASGSVYLAISIDTVSGPCPEDGDGPTSALGPLLESYLTPWHWPVVVHLKRYYYTTNLFKISKYPSSKIERSQLATHQKSANPCPHTNISPSVCLVCLFQQSICAHVCKWPKWRYFEWFASHWP